MPEDEPTLADDLIEVERWSSRWHATEPSDGLPSFQKVDVANALAPLFQKYGIDGTALLADAEASTTDTVNESYVALSKLKRCVEREFWRRWNPELPREPFRCLGPKSKEAKSAVDSFVGIEGRFKRILRSSWPFDPIDADYDDCDEWREQLTALCKDAGLALQQASTVLDPPFWGLRSFEIEERWDSFDEVPGVMSLSPEDYWLLFLHDVLTETEFASAMTFPLDRLGPGFAFRLVDRVGDRHSDEVIDPYCGEHELLCSTSILACRLFANWCAGERLAGATPVVDEATFSVRWWGKTCKLGNKQQFRLIQELAKAPNTFLTFATLAERIGRRSDDKIADVKKRLIDALENAGMSGLAKCIHTQTGYYGLFLD